MNKCRLTLIISVYNGEKYILNLLNDIKYQTNDNSETIIINDGSTDNTLQIIEKFIEENKMNVKLINQKNRGVSFSRNVGIENATGEYIGFLDCDDRISHHYVSHVLSVIEKRKVDLCIFSYNKIQKEKNIFELSKKSNDLTKEELLSQIFEFDSIGCALWNKVLKKSIIEENKIRFNSQIAIGEDMLFLLKYILCSEIFYFLNEPLYSYYLHSENTMNSIKKTFNMKYFTEWDAIMKANEYINHYFKDQPFDSLYKKTVLIAHKLQKYCFQHKYNGDYKDDIHLYLKKEMKHILKSHLFKYRTRLNILNYFIRESIR